MCQEMLRVLADSTGARVRTGVKASSQRKAGPFLQA